MSSTIIDPLAEIESLSGVSEINTSNPAIYNPYRLIILSGLYRAQFLSFQHLKDLTKIKSDGNLASHLRALEKQGLTGYHKAIAGRRTITFYFLTKDGKEVFQELMTGLQKFVNGYKK